ncbi:phage tail protein, partial [Edwardsiella anguillarum]
MQKNQHGADIPDKARFINNLGLRETINQAGNAVPSTRRINNHPLSNDITLTAGDVSAFAL